MFQPPNEANKVGWISSFAYNLADINMKQLRQRRCRSQHRRHLVGYMYIALVVARIQREVFQTEQ